MQEKTNVKTEKINLTSRDIAKAIETNNPFLLDKDPLKNLKCLQELHYHILVECDKNFLERIVLTDKKLLYYADQLQNTDPNKTEHYNNMALRTLKSINVLNDRLITLKYEIDTLKDELELLKK